LGALPFFTPGILLLLFLSLHDLVDSNLTPYTHLGLLEAVGELLGLLIHKVCAPRCPLRIVGTIRRCVGAILKRLEQCISMVALRNVPQEEFT
jgi:hypothetical protein